MEVRALTGSNVSMCEQYERPSYLRSFSGYDHVVVASFGLFRKGSAPGAVEVL